MNKLNSDRFAGVEIVLIVIVLLIAGVASGAVWAIENADDGKNNVIYNANNGTNDSEEYKEAQYIEDIMFSSPEHVFYAWCDQPNGKGNLYIPYEKVKSDLNLYAVWTSADAKESLQKAIDIYGDGKMGPFEMDSSSTGTVAMAYGPENIQEEHLQQIAISVKDASQIKESYESSVNIAKSIIQTYRAAGLNITEITDAHGLTEGYGLYYSGPVTEGHATVFLYSAYKGGEMIGIAYSIDRLDSFSLEEANALVTAMANAIS